MNYYQRYIFQHLVWPAILITVSLTSMIWLTQTLRFVDLIVNRGLSVADFIYITGLLLPSLLVLLIPVALFLAIIFTYHRLQGDSELTILRASGISPIQLALPAVAMAGLASIISYLLSLYIMPASNRQFNDMRTFLRDNYASVLLQEEVFNNPTDGLTVFIRARDEAGNLSGILVHDNRLMQAPVTMMAEQGKLIKGANGPQFYLEKGIRQERRDGRVSWLNFDQYTMDLSFYTSTMRERVRDTDELGVGELFAFNDPDPKRTAKARAEAHQRIVWPLYNIAFVLIAVSWLLSGEYNRRGQWRRIAAASVSVLICALAAIGLRNVIVSYPMMTPLLYLLVSGVIFACLLRLAMPLTIMPPLHAAGRQA